MELRDVDFYISFRNTEMGKLASGGVLNEVKKNILSKTSSANSKNELYLFSSVSKTYFKKIMKAFLFYFKNTFINLISMTLM
jgi:hypothetical protein